MLTEKIIKVPEVKNVETGEVLKEAYEFKIKTRDDVPFRSITDLKGYEGHEIHNQPSVCNSEDFVPIEKLVNMIFRTKSISEILADQEKYASDYDEDDEIELLEDPVEQMELVDYLDEQSEAQIAAQTAHAVSEQSAAGTTTTSGEGVNGEAVSDGSAV